MFTRSTESFTEHPGEVEARRKEWKTRRGGGSTEESWKHGGFTEHGERSGKHGVFNGGRMEDAQFYSVFRKGSYLYFFLAGNLKVS